MANDSSRREFLKGAGIGAASVAATATGIAACSPDAKLTTAAEAGPETWHILTQQEVAFFTAAADTIIPKDELSPSGSERSSRTRSTAPAPASAAARVPTTSASNP